jgi:hypothetical protein
MKFETLDRGQSETRRRYRITTREYIYEVTGPKSEEIISAHWHPLAKQQVRRSSLAHWRCGPG